MVFSIRGLSLLVCVALARYTSQFELYIPGFDPQPLTVSELGVDGAGRTSWLVAPAATASPDDVGIPGPITLVEGPSDAAYTISAGDDTIVDNCTIKDGIAICTVSAGGTVELQTETVSPFSVAGGPTSGAAQASVTPTPSNLGSSAKPTDSASNPASPSSVPASSAGTSASAVPNKGERISSTNLLTAAVFVVVGASFFS
ncbi:hypothetical protein FA95DRAFT_1673843 [Auriscalpium vulgare]|uniref:Uncharacterized protein n=1 Tax=Auriscalpium vulgare TaxID=40419 RepID=A0ACB8SCQ5_9AGAM|nr:hypothetical protein FA95DRAFT_1673843 [Auriscalpium vulgare]